MLCETRSKSSYHHVSLGPCLSFKFLLAMDSKLAIRFLLAYQSDPLLFLMTICDPKGGGQIHYPLSSLLKSQSPGENKLMSPLSYLHLLIYQLFHWTTTLEKENGAIMNTDETIMQCPLQETLANLTAILSTKILTFQVDSLPWLYLCIDPTGDSLWFSCYNYVYWSLIW